MEGEGNFSQVALPLFDGEGYDLWSVRMQSYLEGLDLWDAVEENYVVQSLLENPTMTQIKNHKEGKTRKAKAKSCLFAGVSKMNHGVSTYTKKSSTNCHNRTTLNVIRTEMG